MASASPAQRRHLRPASRMHHDPSAVGPPAWSATQISRLNTEWRKLRHAFAYHPFVEIMPLGNDPPGEYQIVYRVTTLVIDEAGQLAYVAACPVRLSLPPEFPHTAPVVKPLVAVFHPNVGTEWFHLDPPWAASRSIAEVVTQVGTLLTLRGYDPAAVANPAALSWVVAHPELLPTDATADCSPEADGGPAARIARLGPATLHDLHERLESAARRLASDAPPQRVELDALGGEARATIPVFLEADVPEFMRTKAAELQEFSDSLAPPDPVWSQIARHLELVRHVGLAAERVAGAEENLRRVLAAQGVEPPSSTSAPRHRSDPIGAAAAEQLTSEVPPIPALAVIAPLAQSLRREVRDAERAVGELRHTLVRLASEPRIATTASNGGSLLARRLDRELSRLSAAAEPARASGASLASLEPILYAARLESAAADRVVAWAEHRRIVQQWNELLDQLKSTDTGEIQSIHIESPSGVEGPFEFEELFRVDGGLGLAAWNVRARVIRVIDAETEQVIGRGAGRVSVALASGAPLTVIVNEHVDDLRVRVEQLLAQEREALSRLRTDGEDAPPSADARVTWVGRLGLILDLPGEQHRAAEVHRRVADLGKNLLADLASIGRFKERLATWRLMSRLLEFAPRAHAERERQLALMGRADARLAEIGARSNRDADSDRLIIARQDAADYERILADRDAAERRLQLVQDGLAGATERLRLRLAKPRLKGSADLPRLRVLRQPPESWTAVEASVSDASLTALAGKLEELLGAFLVPPSALPPGPLPPAASMPLPATAQSRPVLAAENSPGG